METHELIIEIELLERRLTLYEEKYGILSEDFYAALTSGKLGHYDEYDEARADFSRWKGVYETRLRRKQDYTAQPTVAELNSLTETAYLLQSPRNAERLLTALARAQRETVPSQSIEELRREVGLDELETAYGPDQEDDGERSEASPGTVG
jgi:antitoxin YefM